MDSDEDGENEKGISLTHLLFGNIDDEGNLENDFLDPESIRHLHQLPLLGIGTQLKEITDDVESPNFDFKLNKEDGCDTDSDGCENKSPSAVDYSDITELAEDAESKSDDESVVTPSENKTNASEPSTFEGGETPKPSDSVLMPPPPLPPTAKDEAETNNAEIKKSEPVEVPSRPLANMLPSKYKNMDVTKLFPEFRHGQVLRFSRLFGPGKQSSLPQIWKGVKRKRKKHSDEMPSNRVSFEQKPPSSPLPEDCESDDEAKLLKPEEKNRNGSRGNESFKANELSPGLAAWRYGPAKLWYEMLGVPESGEGFDYGFELKKEESSEKEETQIQDVGDNEFPDDAYFMVTMLPWEEDVIWNGEEVKHKVLSKLNSRNNAAGWVPSSLNRTASAFKAKTYSPTLQTGTPKPSSQQGMKAKPSSTNSKICKSILSSCGVSGCFEKKSSSSHQNRYLLLFLTDEE